MCNPPFLVVTLPSPARFQAEGLIVCAPRHPLMAELAHHVIHPATSGAGIGLFLRDRLQDEICRPRGAEPRLAHQQGVRLRLSFAAMASRPQLRFSCMPSQESQDKVRREA